MQIFNISQNIHLSFKMDPNESSFHELKDPLTHKLKKSVNPKDGYHVKNRTAAKEKIRFYYKFPQITLKKEKENEQVRSLVMRASQ